MAKNKVKDEGPEYEKLPDGTVRIGGEMLARLRANNQSREGLAEVHKLTVTAAYEAAEKCVQRLTEDMREWWAKVIAAAGLDPNTHYTADPHTGIISVIKDEEEGEVPSDAPPILRELVRSLREGGIETVVKRVNPETGEEAWVKDEPKPPAKPN